MSSRSRKMVMISWLGLSWLLASCRFPGVAETPSIGTLDVPATHMAATLTAASVASSPTTFATQATPDLTSPTPTQTVEATATQSPTPTPPAKNVLGKICYPGESIPAMTAYFENTETEAVMELPIAPGQESFEVKLDSGTYIAYAWLPDFSQGGLYSRAVACGLGEECKDHTLLPFKIEQTEITQGIDICDWYAGPFNVPYPPGKEQTEITGVISGSVSHPDGSGIELRVVAFNVRTGYWYWVFAKTGQPFYSITELPPGVYNVVAYDPQGSAGGYADAGHTLLDVTVEPGKVTDGIDVNDWNAPAGTYPPDPTR